MKKFILSFLFLFLLMICVPEDIYNSFERNFRIYRTEVKIKSVYYITDADMFGWIGEWYDRDFEMKDMVKITVNNNGGIMSEEEIRAGLYEIDLMVQFVVIMEEVFLFPIWKPSEEKLELEIKEVTMYEFENIVTEESKNYAFSIF